MLTARQKKQQQMGIDDVANACRDRWMSLPEVMAAAQVSSATARKYIRILIRDELMDSREMKVGDRWRKEYLTMPPGYVAPLYHTHLDAMPLAMCFRGYTFLNAPQQEAPAWHP